MCRSIRTLRQPDGIATEAEIRAAALQFVRKVSGYRTPSTLNETAFNAAVDEVTAVAERLIQSLHIASPPRDREEEARKAREREDRVS